jgi:hypothetical protein
MGWCVNAFELLESGYIVHPHAFGVDHPFLESTFLREDQAIFGTFTPPRATALYDTARHCKQPAQTQSGSVAGRQS